MKRILFLASISFMMLYTTVVFAQTDADNFYKSSSVRIEKVSFPNQYKMTIVGNLMHPTYIPEGVKRAAIVVGHPKGAVKEQSANLYATKMAERGFITLSIDLPFWGESEGEPRNAVSVEIYAEVFSATVDYLSTQPLVDRQQIGAIGICGSGSFVLSAAKIDPDIKAIATISMYDMGAGSHNALGKSQTLEQRKTIVLQTAEQRYAEYAGGETQYTGGTAYSIDENSDPITHKFSDIYRTPRGEFTPIGATSFSTTRPTLTSNVKFMNFYPLNDLDVISPLALLFVTGDQARSKGFSEDAHRKASQPKELYYVKGAGHVDLYDRTSLIPFDKLKTFFNEYLK